jgi:catechol 2,3-dioxygenase-like lactoylglutathione lyase family enzyme
MTTIVLWADRFEECRDFYQTLLSATLSDESADFVNVTGVNGSVLLHRVPEEWASDTSQPAEVREENPIKPVFQVSSISQVRDALAESTGRLFDATREQTYGDTTYCDGVDPDGNVVQAFEKAK